MSRRSAIQAELEELMDLRDGFELSIEDIERQIDDLEDELLNLDDEEE